MTKCVFARRAGGVSVISVAMVAGLSVGAHAGPGFTREWAAGVNGFFQDDFNWTPSFVPGVNDVALIGRDGAFTVGFRAGASTDRLRVNAGTVTLDLGGHVYSLLRDTSTTASTPSLTVGSPGATTPTLRVTNGELRLFSAIVGEAAGRSGKIQVDGAGAFLNMQRTLFLGFNGSGIVEVENGATAFSHQSLIGTVRTSGDEDASSRISVRTGGVWTTETRLTVGANNSTGLAEAFNGGTVNAGELFVATSTGADGTAGAAGSDSLMHILGDAVVGANGAERRARLAAVFGGVVQIDGNLRYGEGSIVEAFAGTLDVGSLEYQGDTTDSNVVMLLAGGTLRVRGDVNTFDLGLNALFTESEVIVDGALRLDPRRGLRIDEGSASLTAGSIAGDGDIELVSGRLTLGTMTLGTGAGQTTDLAIGMGQSFSSGRFTVEGQAIIDAGASLSMTNSVTRFGSTVSNSGSISIVGSTVTIDGAPGGGFGGLNGLISAGSLTITDSTINGDVNNGVGASFVVGGDVVFNGRVGLRSGISASGEASGGRASLAFNHEVMLGFLPFQISRVSVDADVVFGEGNALLLEFGGTGAAQYDGLDVLGALTIGGSLSVDLLAAYQPKAGDEFRFLTAGEFTGEFATVDVDALPDGLEWDTRRINEGVLRVIPAPGGAVVGVLALALGGCRCRARGG